MLSLLWDNLFLMRQESPEALKISPNFIVQNKRGAGSFQIDASGHQQFIPFEKAATPVQSETNSHLNWFGSKESVGMFTAKLFEGMGALFRGLHGLETRTITEIVNEQESSQRENIVKLDLPEPLVRKEILSQAS